MNDNAIEKLIEALGDYGVPPSAAKLILNEMQIKTLSAVRDGRLELLGEVGRGTISCTTDGREIYQTDWKGRIPVDLPAIERQHAWSVYDFIALSPMGTEEEK